MKSYKYITFCEGLNCTLAEFKKDFAPHLKSLSESEIKEAHKVATNGSNTTTSRKSKKTNTNKGKA